MSRAPRAVGVVRRTRQSKSDPVEQQHNHHAAQTAFAGTFPCC